LHLFRCLENFEEGRKKKKTKLRKETLNQKCIVSNLSWRERERERELFLLQNPAILTCVFFVLSNYWGGKERGEACQQ
jgi:hypothetical protein